MSQSTDSSSGVRPPAEPAVQDPDAAIPFVIHPMIQLAQKTFERDFPKLWEQRPRQWVAYHGAKQLGFGKTRTELLQKFWRQGILDDELHVCLIEPHGDEFLGEDRLIWCPANESVS